MDFSTLQTIPYSLSVIMDPMVIGWIMAGTVVGIIFGAAPGLTAATAVALFTPVTFYMSTTISLGFLLGIYCGGFYAGSIPAILINTPGAPGNAATVLDGYAMARKGFAGEALSYSVVSSWIGGTLSAFALLVFAPLIGAFALKFGAPEYFSVALLGLVCIAGISGDSLLKGIAGAAIGMFLGCIGMDPIGGISRFTFDSVDLMGGIALIPALVGLFAMTEVLAQAERVNTSAGEIISQVKRLMPNWREYWKYKNVIIRSTIIGTVIGAIPGTGPTIASWMSYNDARTCSKHPEKFGTGIPEGIMAPESSNNAVTGGALIPLITLGVPGDTVTAILLGALMIQGLTPGPMLIKERPELVSLLLLILLVANVCMLVLGLAASKYAPCILRMPMKILLPIVTVLCVTGAYAVNNSFFDVKFMMIAGIIGFALLKFGFPVPPIVLGMILGPIIEPNMRRALIGSQMNPAVFVTSPLSAGLLVLTVILVVYMHRKNKEAKALAMSK
jgi:putative tricarboxylic transport membrane protein